MQLHRGERCCFPFLNTCWVPWWSIQVCGLLLPFLCCSKLPGSSFLYPSLSLALGQLLTFTTGEQNYSIFLWSQGTKLTEMPLLSQKHHTRLKALVSGGGFSLASQQKLLCTACERVFLGGCSFTKYLKLTQCLQIGAFWFGGIFFLWVVSVPCSCSSSIVNFFYTNKKFIIAKSIFFSDSVFSTDTLRTLKFETFN